MQDQIEEDYLLQLIKLALRDRKHLELLRQHLKYEYFPEESYKRLWRIITVEYDSSVNKKPPLIPVLQQHFKKDLEVKQILSDLKDIELGDDKDVLRHLETFLKQNLFVLSYNEIGQLYNKGKKETAYSEFQRRAEEFVNFTLTSKIFDKVFGDFNTRNFNREIDKIHGFDRIRIPSGIDELDHYVKGFETGELIMVMGDSGSGKSFMGNHLGVNSARRGYNVYHAQAEGTKQQVLDRYDSCFTGTRYHDVKINDFGDERKKKSIDTVINSIRGEVFVRAFEQFGSAVITDIRSDIIEANKNLTEPIRMVIVDYLELFEPGDGNRYGADAERFRQQKIARYLKNMAMELNVVVIVFTQASSVNPIDLNNPDFVITRYNLSEDKGKVRPTDMFITINRTKDEKKEQICRLYIDKAREHSGGQVIYIKQNLNQSRFYDRKKTLAEFFDLDTVE